MKLVRRVYLAALVQRKLARKRIKQIISKIYADCESVLSTVHW